MSNSLLPKKSPNALNQETLERVLVILRQPFSIAVLASLGLHGLLWAALPNMLANTEKEPDTKQRVQTVELSPAEQSQLPSFGISQVPPTLLPSKAAKPSQSGTKLPDPKLYNDPSLYNFPLLQPPPPILFPSFGLPPTGLDFNQPPVKKTPKPATPTKPPSPPTAPTAPDEGSKTDKDSTRATGDSTAPARQDKLSSEQLAARRQEGERSLQLRSLYAFSGPETQDKALESAKTNATVFVDAAIKLSGGEYDSKRYQNSEKIESPFPEEACPFIKDSRTGTVGVIVKPDGQLAEKPTLLLTSGFKGLDTIAIDEIVKTKFTTSERYQIIRFEVTFNPSSVCKAARSKPS